MTVGKALYGLFPKHGDDRTKRRQGPFANKVQVILTANSSFTGKFLGRASTLWYKPGATISSFLVPRIQIIDSVSRLLANSTCTIFGSITPICTTSAFSMPLVGFISESATTLLESWKGRLTIPVIRRSRPRGIMGAPVTSSPPPIGNIRTATIVSWLASHTYIPPLLPLALCADLNDP